MDCDALTNPTRIIFFQFITQTIIHATKIGMQ
jgi:hypothetical protein